MATVGVRLRSMPASRHSGCAGPRRRESRWWQPCICLKKEHISMPDKPKRYRLTLDFIVSINDEILDYSEESIAELDDDEKRALQAQRALLKGLLGDKQGILKELLRKRVLEEASFEVDGE